MPSRTIASGPSPEIVSPLNTISPEVGLERPEIARKVVDLPAPLAEQGHDLAFLDAEGDAAQRFDFAVANDEVADFEQRHHSLPR